MADFIHGSMAVSYTHLGNGAGNGYPGGSNAGAYTGGNGGSGGAGDDSNTAKAGSDGSKDVYKRQFSGWRI